MEGQWFLKYNFDFYYSFMSKSDLGFFYRNRNENHRDDFQKFKCNSDEFYVKIV